jgi:nonsense-mediated mRNA decay protein 3
MYCGSYHIQVTILWCKECGRYLQPPKHWVRAEPESKELLTFCTKRIRGLQVRRLGCVVLS